MVLEQNETWELVTLSSGKKAVGCKWVYNVKLNLDGSLARLKARLVAKRLFISVWTRLCEFFLPGREDDICADHCIIGSDLPLTTSSIGHQECLSQ